MRWILFLFLTSVIAEQLVSPIEMKLDKNDVIIANWECGSKARSVILFRSPNNPVYTTQMSQQLPGMNEILRANFQHDETNCSLQMSIADRPNLTECSHPFPPGTFFLIIGFIVAMLSYAYNQGLIDEPKASPEGKKTS
jgi:hypothetical protein